MSFQVFMIRFFSFLLSLSACFLLHSEEYPYRFEGKFEGWVDKKMDLISVFLPVNPVIFQAGGCQGVETVNLSLAWPLSKIISFEPNPSAFSNLSFRTALFNNIRVHNLALYDRPGLLSFYLCHGTTGKDPSFEHASSLLTPSEAMKIHYQGPCIKVECVVLDEWCQQNEIDHIDFLRLNLQGSELQVLKSSPQILATVRAIYVDTYFFLFRLGMTQFPELRKFLESSGFILLSHWYRNGLDGSAIFIKKDFYDSVAK